MLIHQHLKLVQEWNEAREQLKYWNQKEGELREAVVTSVFTSTKTEGSETIDLAADWKLKATKKFNYNLTNKDNSLVNIIRTMPQVIIENLVRWNPDLNLTVYRKLDSAMQELLTPVLTIKPAKPTLELVPPNANSVHE